MSRGTAVLMHAAQDEQASTDVLASCTCLQLIFLLIIASGNTGTCKQPTRCMQLKRSTAATLQSCDWILAHINMQEML